MSGGAAVSAARVRVGVVSYCLIVLLSFAGRTAATRTVSVTDGATFRSHPRVVPVWRNAPPQRAPCGLSHAWLRTYARRHLVRVAVNRYGLRTELGVMLVSRPPLSPITSA